MKKNKDNILKLNTSFITTLCVPLLLLLIVMISHRQFHTLLVTSHGSQ